MPMKYTEKSIIHAVKKHEAEMSTKELSLSLNIASSTLYRWVKSYKTIPRKHGEYTPARHQQLFDHERKLERRLEIQSSHF